jgi:hypothetical protein
MALGHVTRLFGVNDCGIYKMTADVAGSPPTYGSKFDVVGIKSLESTLDTDIKTLRGDNTLLAADAVLKDLKGKLGYAKMSFDVWAVVTTMTATDSGSTPNQKTTTTLSQNDVVANFKIEAQCKQVDYVGGDVHVLLHKCIPGNLAAGFSEEDYRDQEFDFQAFPVIGTPTGLPANSWMTIVGNETAVALV